MCTIIKHIVKIKNRTRSFWGLPTTWMENKKIALVRYVRRLQRVPTDDRRCHARFAILEMVGPSNTAALPPRHKEKRPCARVYTERSRCGLHSRAPAGRSSQPACPRAHQRLVLLSIAWHHRNGSQSGRGSSGMRLLP